MLVGQVVPHALIYAAGGDLARSRFFRREQGFGAVGTQLRKREFHARAMLPR